MLHDCDQCCSSYDFHTLSDMSTFLNPLHEYPEACVLLLDRSSLVTVYRFLGSTSTGMKAVSVSQCLIRSLKSGHCCSSHMGSKENKIHLIIFVSRIPAGGSPTGPSMVLTSLRPKDLSDSDCASGTVP